MSNKEKLIEKLKNSPKNIKYKEIETLFQNDDFLIREGKGSHKIIFSKKTKNFVTVAIHNNNTKEFYKKRLLKLYLNNYN